MDHQNNLDAACVARARTLLAAAAIGVERLESAASEAFCRLAALTGVMARLEGLGGSREPEAGEAAALDAATLCREAAVLLRYVSTRHWPAGRAVAKGGRRRCAPALTAGGASAAASDRALNGNANAQSRGGGRRARPGAAPAAR